MAIKYVWIKEIKWLIKLGLILKNKLRLERNTSWIMVNQAIKGNLQIDWGLIKVNEVRDNLREDHYLIKQID